MHKPGESVTTIDVGSVSDWLHLLVAVAPYVGLMLVLGILIGIICRHYPRVHGPVSIIMGILSYAFVLWRYGSPDEWSWRQPIVSALYQIAPAATFFVGPARLGAGIARWFLCRHASAGAPAVDAEG